LSLAEVAERCGLFPQAVARAERKGIDPRVSTVAAIAKALGVPGCELLDEDTKHEQHRTKRTRRR
jgi:transcriptional regulator with XRE-family HTH domain